MVLIKIWCMLLYFRLAVSAAITVTEGVLQSGKTFDLTCHSDVPVHWCYPEKYTIPDHSERNIYKSPKNITYNKEGSKYSTTIQIQNANYVYTGFYHCLRNDTQSLCNRHVDSSEKSTYIFVKDAENLMVITGFTNVFINKDDIAILPCLPTSPNVKMTLMIDGEEMELGKDSHSELTVEFKNTTGFTLTSMSSKKSNDYVCTATLDGITKKLVSSVSYYPVGVNRTSSTTASSTKGTGSSVRFSDILICFVFFFILIQG